MSNGEVDDQTHIFQSSFVSNNGNDKELGLLFCRNNFWPKRIWYNLEEKKMQAFTKNIVIDYSVRNLCFKPYPNHPKGCPNFDKRPLCPPKCPRIEDMFDMLQGFWVVWVEFDFAAHVKRMARKHPEWSQCQKECCLYWQGTANKMLREAVADVEYYLKETGNYKTTYCPEAMGVNVTATMKNLGVVLEWPPKNIVRKVALIGQRKNA